MASLVAIAWLFCRQLLPLSRAIDKLGEWLGVIASWLVLLACLVSAINATVRYLVSYSSNAWLELQWYMFAGMVLLGAAYTLKVNEHVRVDLIYGTISDRARHWIDLLGGAIFLTPMCLVMIWFTWPWFVQAWTLNESSSNAGGLIRWPVILLLPVGFALILLQGFSEMIKRAAALRGFHQHEYAYEKPLQ
ncbi:TRAP transporter small permease subunit [Bosea sp. (in: a-proteobacteria)]|uniref:TRAP transporter small permease subunit n=1 Tax=Bosea sp. (in: a-proteobacteria) TaxID=1871050 RepID=UPI001AC48CC8|nr:TRAP transporter small permease subunit [Bosea sp. (in: a-proteobacteria)]MBN9436386.1 TRAP transporter small permease subunit [Bosea sp. (in: a-proteobacteria)]